MPEEFVQIKKKNKAHTYQCKKLSPIIQSFHTDVVQMFMQYFTGPTPQIINLKTQEISLYFFRANNA